MDEYRLFPGLPEDLAALSDAELQGLLDESLSAKDKIVAQDAEFLGELSAADVLEQMKTGVAGILALKAEQARRVEAQENLAAELAALNAQVEPEQTLDANEDDEGDADDSNGDDDADDDDAAASLAADDPEPVVASAPEPKPLRRMPAQGRHQPVDLTAHQQPVGPVFRASAGMSDFQPGQELDPHDGLNSLNMALGKAVQMASASMPGMRDTPVIARMDISEGMPEHRILRSQGETTADKDKITALVAAAKRSGVAEYDPDTWAETEALTASGGICAPVTPYYQLAFISEMARPVRDSLVGFVADRGGIQFLPPPYLSQITTGVGVITAAQDAAGGTPGTKTCQTLICPNSQTVQVESIFHCFQGGNLGQRAFPEQASQFSSLILAQHARVAETQLLNQIKAGSTNVLGQSTVLGAISSLLNDMLTAAAAYRNNNRMASDAPLQVIAPAWVKEVLLIDLLQSQFQRFSMDQNGLAALFGAFNLRVTYTLDGPTDGEGQVLARQSGSLGPSAPGSLAGTFPTVVEWALFHPGAWLFVDSGVLELGIVRDSVLNATNSYQVFGESWEAAAGIGVQSEWVTSNICASGTVALPIATTHQCGT